MKVYYRNPFGRETLSCGMTVRRGQEDETKKEGTEEK